METNRRTCSTKATHRLCWNWLQWLPHQQTYLTSRAPYKHKVFLLIMVLSGPSNVDRRTDIRMGVRSVNEDKMEDHISSGSCYVWQCPEWIFKSWGNYVQRCNTRFSKRTLSQSHLKRQMGLELASKYCDFEFLLKADDDIFVNPYKQMDYLAKPGTPKIKLYTGRCPQGGLPHRKGKYALSWEEYNKNRFPPFCDGPAYAILGPGMNLTSTWKKARMT